MFRKDTVVGILLGASKFELHVDAHPASSLGYRVRPRLNIRAEKEFLLGLRDSLEKYDITTTFRDEEHSARKKPILRITGISNLHKICQMVPEYLPDAKNEWQNIRKIIQMMVSKEHLTLAGLDKILEIKGLI